MGGMREILAENVLAALLDLECASGNDTRISESEIRVGAKIMPHLMSGTDFLCSGFGSIPAYDNSFAASLFNAEELEDFLVLQRDFELDGGLRHLPEDQVMAVRRRAVEALEAVYRDLGLAELNERQKQSVLEASGSRDTETFSFKEVCRISEQIERRKITLIDIITALGRSGYEDIAEDLLVLLRQRVSGDYLQTAAIVRGGQVVSAVNHPNDYMGPNSGYRLSEGRRREIAEIRRILTKEQIFDTEERHATEERRRYHLEPIGPATKGDRNDEVVIAVSPAFGLRLHRTTSGLFLSRILSVLMSGIEDGGGTVRVVRVWHTADTSFLGLTAARLSGSGIGIGIQAKGTAVIHTADDYPHMNLELFSQAPITTLDHYRGMGRNAADYARNMQPEPVNIPYQGEALGARFHVQTSLIYAIETGMIKRDDEPEELRVTFYDR